jgi:hypothetical protein
MLELWQTGAIIVLAFLCEYMDSTLGMGYGTTLTPIFMLLGFTPIQIVPVILLSELISGLLAGFFHHREGNVNLKPQSADIFKITKLLSPLGYIECFKKTVPPHLKVALLLAACSIVGTIVAVLVALNIPKFWLNLYIGCLVLSMGVIILVTLNKKFNFSWKKITLLGLVASFNKGMSGGGYGPVVTGGQILAGVDGRSAVGITSLAEGLTCAVGVLAYIFISKKPLDWALAPWVIIGAVLSVPLSAKSVKIMNEKKLKLAIALLTLTLGTVTIIKILK